MLAKLVTWPHLATWNAEEYSLYTYLKLLEKTRMGVLTTEGQASIYSGEKTKVFSLVKYNNNDNFPKAQFFSTLNNNSSN